MTTPTQPSSHEGIAISDFEREESGFYKPRDPFIGTTKITKEDIVQDFRSPADALPTTPTQPADEMAANEIDLTVRPAATTPSEGAVASNTLTEMAAMPSEVVEKVARAIQQSERSMGKHICGWDSLGPQTQSHLLMSARAAISAIRALPKPVAAMPSEEVIEAGYRALVACKPMTSTDCEREACEAIYTAMRALAKPDEKRLPSTSFVVESDGGGDVSQGAKPDDSVVAMAGVAVAKVLDELNSEAELGTMQHPNDEQAFRKHCSERLARAVLASLATGDDGIDTSPNEEETSP